MIKVKTTKKKTYLIIGIILYTFIVIISTLGFYITSISSHKITTLYGTYQSDKINDIGHLQLSFLSEENKFFKLYDNTLVESGTYAKNNDINNAYTLTINGRKDIVLIEEDHIYYIENSNIYELKLVISAPVIPN